MMNYECNQNACEEIVKRLNVYLKHVGSVINAGLGKSA